jgi:hypothetical protein
MNDDVKHKHHIIPKHMGGTDDPDNIVTLSVPEHKVAHLKLYYRYGKREDLCAYYMLSGNIEKFRKQLRSHWRKCYSAQKKRARLKLFSV